MGIVWLAQGNTRIQSRIQVDAHDVTCTLQVITCTLVNQ